MRCRSVSRLSPRGLAWAAENLGLTNDFCKNEYHDFRPSSSAMTGAFGFAKGQRLDRLPSPAQLAAGLGRCTRCATTGQRPSRLPNSKTNCQAFGSRLTRLFVDPGIPPSLGKQIVCWPTPGQNVAKRAEATIPSFAQPRAGRGVELLVSFFLPLASWQRTFRFDCISPRATTPQDKLRNIGAR